MSLRKTVLLMWAAVSLISTQCLAAEAPPAEEEEAPESVVSSPPMEMDDPGTPGKNGLEVNFVGTMFRVGPGRSTESLLDANYGIGDRIQLKYERPYVTESDGGVSLHGLGATELGIKWRFIDSHGLAIAFYPNYSFDDAFKIKDEEGNVEESEGRSEYFPILLTQSLGRHYTLAFNYGYRHSLEGHGDDNNVALGFGKAVGGDGRVMAELFSERDDAFRNRQTDVRVGYFFLPFPEKFAHLKYETPVYASLGHSIGATESGEKSTSICLGFSFIVKPQE